jgi:hypothetical protein
MAEILTEQQKRFCDLFGCLVLPGLLADVIEDVTSEFEATLAKHRDADGGTPEGEGGQAPSPLGNFIDGGERLRALLDDPRIDGIAAGLPKDDYNYPLREGHLKSGDTDWHTSKPNREPRHHRLVALYLDPVVADTGALRVIPGSHKADAFRDEDMPAVARQNFGSGLNPVDPDDIDRIADVLAAHNTQCTGERNIP